MTPELHVTEVVTRAELAGYRRDWEALHAACPQAELFSTPLWVEAWMETFWPGSIAFVLVWSGDRLVGLLPLLEDEAGMLSAPTLCRHALAAPVNAHARRCDILLAGADTSIAVAAIDHLHAQRGGLRLTFGTVRSDSPAQLAWETAATDRGLRVDSRAMPGSPVIEIREDWDGYLGALDRQVRRELRRKARRLEETGTARWRMIDDVGGFDAAFADVLEIERQSWKDSNGTSFETEHVAQFYRRVLHSAAARGWLRLHLLSIDERPVAHLCGIAQGGTLYALKTSYDQRSAGLSPGVLVVMQALQAAFTERLTAFDLLGSSTRWKRDIANAERSHRQVCVTESTDLRCAACNILELRVRPVVSRLLRKVRTARTSGGHPVGAGSAK